MLTFRLFGLGAGILYDFDLHMRFIKSATEAWFNYATAGWVALEVWQNQAVNSLASQPEPAKPPVQTLPDNPFTWWMSVFTPASQPQARTPAPQPLAANPFTWWMDALAPASQPAPSTKSDFGAPFFQFSPAAAAFNPNAFFGGGAASGANPWAMMPWMSASSTPWGNNPWASGLPEMMQQACCWTWPQASFSMFQMPMTAWLMAVGIPYSVAAPTARANTASMDAAQAAREGFEKAMTSFKTDGGHAMTTALQSLPKLTPLLFSFWLMPHLMPSAA